MQIIKRCVGMVQTNCYIAYNTKSREAFCVDPGDSADLILNTMKKNGLDLKYVLLTHGHFDHVLAVSEILEKTGAQLVASAKERLDDADLGGFRAFRLPMFRPLHADVTVGDGDTLNVSGQALQFIETPGHTTGSMCILAEDILFSGDTLFAGSCGRCDLPGGDYHAMLDSLGKLASLKGDYRVLPGHGEESTLGIERKKNPYMREATGR